MPKAETTPEKLAGDGVGVPESAELQTPTAVAAAGKFGGAAAPAAGVRRGVWIDAWRTLRKNPSFVLSLVVIAGLLLMAIVPGLFTSGDPNHGVLAKSLQPPSAESWLGYDVNGRSIWTRIVYGTRASLTVGFACTIGTALLGGLLGAVAAYSGGIVDTVISRVADMLLGIPFILGAIIVLSTMTDYNSSTLKIEGIIIGTIIVFGWPTIARVLRSTIMTARNADYTLAGHVLGLSGARILVRHILPNAVAPVIVLSTMRVSGYIATEASLSYLGLGLHPPAVSWGQMVSDGQPYLRTSAYVLLFPSLFLALTILAFVLVGEALRRAIDPTNRR